MKQFNKPLTDAYAARIAIFTQDGTDWADIYRALSRMNERVSEMPLGVRMSVSHALEIATNALHAKYRYHFAKAEEAGLEAVKVLRWAEHIGSEWFAEGARAAIAEAREKCDELEYADDNARAEVFADMELLRIYLSGRY